MKMLLCSDVKLGAVSSEKLDVQLSQKWQAVRATRFEELMDQAAQNNACYLLFMGQTFGQARVTEGLIDKLFALARSSSDIHLLLLLDMEEFQRLAYRKDVPENLHTLTLQNESTLQVDDLTVCTRNGTAELRWRECDAVHIGQDSQGRFSLMLSGQAQQIPVLEPTGFEDAEDALCGYGLLTLTDTSPAQYQASGSAAFTYHTIEIRILPGDDQKEILRKLSAATRDVKRNTFLRITLTGRSAFGLTINADALKMQLQNRIFFVDVYDNTVMDTEADAFETDISLRSEFVRLALADESLSESERNRVISCGWNALSGKEVAEE